MRKKLLPYICPAALVFSLAAVSVAGAAEAKETGSFRKIWDLVWIFLNFAIMVFLLVKYGRKPLVDFLARYSSDIGENLDKNKSALASAEEEYQESEKKLADLGEKIEELEELTQAQARRVREKILEEAEEGSKLIISRARDQAGLEIRKARASVKTELVEMALDEAEKKIKEQLRPEDEERIIDEYVKRLDEPDEPDEP